MSVGHGPLLDALVREFIDPVSSRQDVSGVWLLKPDPGHGRSPVVWVGVPSDREDVAREIDAELSDRIEDLRARGLPEGVGFTFAVMLDDGHGRLRPLSSDDPLGPIDVP
jgi:hypothetical protein